MRKNMVLNLIQVKIKKLAFLSDRHWLIYTWVLIQDERGIVSTGQNPGMLSTPVEIHAPQEIAFNQTWRECHKWDEKCQA